MDYDAGLHELDPDSKISLPPEVLDTDFKRKYPPESMLGTELDDGARVWKAFRDEATAHDSSMLDGWNNTLDILLIFAGLFSAVATAFLTESYKLLQPDESADYTATALYALVVATNNSAALRLLPPPPSASTEIAASSRWINGLWFTSLFLSLSVALLCILGKQWLGEYTAQTTGSASARLWARRRMFYFDGLSMWHLAGFISILPLLLHLALFLFFGGLGAFLYVLDRAIGAWLGVGSVALSLFYAVTTALPLWWPDCPTSTPLVKLMQKSLIKLVTFALSQCIVAVPKISRLMRTLYTSVRGRNSATDPEATAPLPPPRSDRIVSALKDTLVRLADHDSRSILRIHLHDHQDHIDASVLRWLILSVSDSDSIAVGLQAIGALRPWSPLADLLRSDDFLEASTFDRMCTSYTQSRSAAELARIVRSMLCLHGNQPNKSKWGFVVPQSVLRDLLASDYPDLGLLGASLLNWLWYLKPRAGAWLAAPSPSLTSTALLLLHCPGITVLHSLHVLVTLKLIELSQDDWECVARALRYAPPTCPRHFDGGCSSLCRADFLAHVALDLDAAQLLSGEASLAVELVEHALSMDWDPDWSIWTLPHLLEFLATDACLAVDFSHSAMLQLCSTISDWWRLPSEVTTTLSSLNRALLNILELAARQKPVADSNVHIPFGRCVGVIYAKLLAEDSDPGGHPRLFHGIGAPDDHPPLITVLALLLDGPEDRDMDASTWKRMNELGLSDYVFLKLASDTAAALCVLSREGANTASMVDSFFSLRPSIFIRELRCALEFVAGGREESLIVLVKRLIQHCVELRPSWWFTLLNAATADDDGDLVEELDSILAQLGPCLECPGRPPGWVQDVDERPTDCNFDPSC